MKYREIHIKEEDLENIAELLTSFILKQNKLRNLCLEMQDLEIEKIDEEFLYSHIYFSLLNKHYSTMHVIERKRKNINLNKTIVGPWYNIYTMLAEICSKRSLSDEDWINLAKSSHNGYELLKVYNNYKLFHLEHENDNLLTLLDPRSTEYNYLKLLLLKRNIEKDLKDKYGELTAEEYINYLNSYKNKEKDKMLFIYSGNATLEEYREYIDELGKGKKAKKNKMIIDKINKRFYQNKNFVLQRKSNTSLI